jgi:hypothetical protein
MGMRSLTSLGRGLALIAAATLTTSVIAAVAEGAASPWTVLPSANAGAAANNVFRGVSMVDNAHGFAVGAAGSQATIQSWNGVSWNLMNTPNPDSFDTLRAVAAVSPTDAWAVGTATATSGGPERTLIEHYDGTAWTIVPSPNIGVSSQLNAVTARAADDVWAVGQDGVNESQPIIEHWNGTAWSVVTGAALPSGATALLTGVTTTSDGAVWAVGAVQKPLQPEGVARTAFIERLSAGVWASLPVPATNPAFNVTLNAVSAASPTDVWAVGTQGGRALAEHWDGTAWSFVPTPTISGTSIVLKGVTAVGPHDAWFVGDQNLGTISMQSDGATTTVMPTPSGSSRGDLTAVARVGSALYAVGSQTNNATTLQSQTFALTNPNG